MRFQVVGAHSESGDDVNVMLEAATRPEVELLAHEKGILVSSITPLAAPGTEALAPAPKGDPEAIALIDDEPANGNGKAAAHDSVRGFITVNANSPSETAHTGAGHIEGDHHGATPMEYHIIMNQSLYLLETAVNKHTRDGWEPQGGLAVGMRNNALEYFQSMIRRKPGPPVTPHPAG